MKSRDRGQNNVDDVREKDFRRELEERERSAAATKRGTSQREKEREREKALEQPKKSRMDNSNVDADDPLDDSDDSDSDSDDDTALLMAELHKIKQEKAAEEREKVGNYRINLQNGHNQNGETCLAFSGRGASSGGGEDPHGEHFDR